FFFEAEDGIRDDLVTGVQTCALPISMDAREFRQLGHHVVDLLSEYFEHIEEKPVFPDVEPQILTDLFAEPLPQAASAPEEVLAEIGRASCRERWGVAEAAVLE